MPAFAEMPDYSHLLTTDDPVHDRTVAVGRHAERQAGTTTPVRPAPHTRPVNPSDPTAGGQIPTPEQRDQYDYEQAMSRIAMGVDMDLLDTIF